MLRKAFLSACALAILLSTFSAIQAQIVQVPQLDPPKVEFRSVWLTTAFGLDWPKTTNKQEQQEALRLIIERMAQMRMNAVVFQVVSRGDAQYESERLPWATRLTGTVDGDPGWDPLQFVIDESRKYGMEVHAWYNLFNVGVESDIAQYESTTDPAHVWKSNPEWVHNFGSGGIWLNPGIPAAREWALGNVMEIVENYDVDAIHFDFARYPQAFPNDFNDRQTYSPGFTGDLASWRRENVTQFMRDAYAAVQEAKPWVKVGSTPFGHYQRSSYSSPPSEPCPYDSCSWGAALSFSQVFQDSKRWLDEEVNDYLAPQIYWAIGPPGPHFEFLTRDWARLRQDSNRHIYIGIGAYQTGSGSNVAAEMGRQVDTVRTYGHQGQIYFRYDNVYGPGGPPTFQNIAKIDYRLRALVPSMPWKDTDQPDAPLSQDVLRNGTTATLTWQAPDFETASGDTKLLYAIYRYKTNPEELYVIDAIIEDPANLVAVTGEHMYIDNTLNANEDYVYIITSLSRNWVESEISDVLDAGRFTSIDDIDQVAREYALHQNYPNPFNPTTNIRYELAEAGHVRLSVYDVTGRLVGILEDSAKPVGVHTVTFTANNMASGVYMYHLEVNGTRLTGRMLLLK